MADEQPTTSCHVNQPPSMQTSATSSDFQTVTQYQIMQLQRIVADLRGTVGREKEKIENLSREFVNATAGIKRLEGKLVNLQMKSRGQDSYNFVAKEYMLKLEAKTEQNLEQVAYDLQKEVAKQQKESTDKDNDNKSQITAIKLEIDALKQTAQSRSRQIEEIRRSYVGGAGAVVPIPENLTQMFAALERQLGLYDVNIVENDVKFQVLETTNYDGKLTWKIMDFARRREEERMQKTLFLDSQPFYTSKYGYKMCLRIYLNGDGMGKNTHISLFFVLMKGDYDALLSFPFRQKVTLMLLDQGPDKRHFSDFFCPDPTCSAFKRPSSNMNIASGCPMFVSHDTINGSSYVKDDTIFIGAIVDTTDLQA